MPLLREVLKWQAGLLLFPAFLALLWLQRPLPEALKDPPAPHPVLRDRHGEELADFPRADFFRHEPASLSEIPQSLIDATLAAEDKRFYEHPGIDYLATLRAFYQNRRHGRITSGASTITQQLVKISRPPTARTHLTKVHESLLARQVESRWSKDQILLAYLNRLDYGHHQQGCATAARHYFDRSLADLSLAQAALLAGLPQAPSRLNPLRHPAAARERRDWILDRLAAEFAYPPELIARAKAEPLQLSPPARSELTPHLNPAALDSARLTISAPLQRATRAIIRRELAALREKNVQHAALVVIHNPSGEILALHGSADFHAANGGQLNGALLPRSPGSTLKPFTYLLALQDHGLFPGTVIPDIPTRYRTSEGLAAPHNFDHRHHGPVTLRHALANSLNVPAMRVLNQIGGPEPLLRLLQHLDIRHLPADASDLGLGLTIGNAEISLLDLTQAYATLARLGRHQKAVLQKRPTAESPERLFSEGSAYLIAHILSDPQARQSAFGHRSPLDLPFPCAVKTGTSSDFRDNWCLGFTSEFTVGVWVGNFDNSPMAGVSGLSGAAPIFNATMRELHHDTPPSFPARPSELVELQIDPRTGHRLTPLSPQKIRHLKKELCPSDRLPAPITLADYDARHRALLPADYRDWFASDENQRASSLALRGDQSDALSAPTPSAPRILSPLPGATYYLDPELPGASIRLSLESNLTGPVRWSSPTLKISEASAQLIPGTHRITLHDPRTGLESSHEITVENL